MKENGYRIALSILCIFMVSGMAYAQEQIIYPAKGQSQARQQKKAEQDWAQKEAANYEQKRTGYNRAFSACMEGRDYTVK